MSDMGGTTSTGGSIGASGIQQVYASSPRKPAGYKDPTGGRGKNFGTIKCPDCAHSVTAHNKNGRCKAGGGHDCLTPDKIKEHDNQRVQELFRDRRG